MTEPGATVRYYRDILDRRTAEEMRELAHIKRFMERLTADAEFRRRLAEQADSPAPVAARYGIEIDPDQARPLWHNPYLRFRGTPEVAQWPLAERWDTYIRQVLAHRDMMRDEGDMRGVCDRFHVWRGRQMRRCLSELGGSGGVITHPVIAFELSRGCTVGCWFCGLSAPKFRDHLPYDTENAGLWRGMLRQAVALFGAAAGTGFCYWATDPCDNPDYDKFLYDYHAATGALPQTTTAAPLKDIGLTRRILALHDRFKTVTNRFSILTLRQLNEVHAAFSAEELMGVELVMQNKEAIAAKAFAGRAQERRQKLRDAGKPDQVSTVTTDHTTIACVSGFLVSVPDRRVQLISPVPGSKRWPLGYRVFGEESFTDPDGFRLALTRLIDRHMDNEVPADGKLGFRADLRMEWHEDGFSLHSRTHAHELRLGAPARHLGELIGRGLTRGELIGAMLDRGIDIFTTGAMLETLFNAGLFQEGDTDTSFVETFMPRPTESQMLSEAAA